MSSVRRERLIFGMAGYRKMAEVATLMKYTTFMNISHTKLMVSCGRFERQVISNADLLACAAGR
jgi:hypothetical protein